LFSLPASPPRFSHFSIFSPLLSPHSGLRTSWITRTLRREKLRNTRTVPVGPGSARKSLQALETGKA
jgi:hypothetical protein